MVGLSNTTGYAILALSCLQDQGDEPKLVRDIAECIGAPRPYLAKVLHKLAGSGLIHTQRGCHGGVRLARPADQITILDVAAAVEGDDVLNRCFLGFGGCDEAKPCALHDTWEPLRERLVQTLNAMTLADIAPYARTHRRSTTDCPGECHKSSPPGKEHHANADRPHGEKPCP